MTSKVFAASADDAAVAGASPAAPKTPNTEHSMSMPKLTHSLSRQSSATENANSIVSDIKAENAIQVDEGKNVTQATGSFACERFGDLQFKFKGAQMFSASTVVFKWRVTGQSNAKVVGEKGERTTKQALNAAVVQLILGPIVGPMMMGAEAKKRENEIELTVWSEQLYTLKACPGVTIDWSFEVKDGRKVDFNVQHTTDLVKSLRYSEELAKAWGEQQHKTKSQLQKSCKEERARIHQEVQEYQAGIDEAKRKTEELKCELELQAELAQQKLTKLVKEQEHAQRTNADKEELVNSLGEKVTALEAQRLGYVEQIGDLSDCLKSLQAEKAKCVQDLWKERELVASKDLELEAEAQTLRMLQQQLEKYRMAMAESGDENQKLADEIVILEKQIKQQEATAEREKLRLAADRAQQQHTVGQLRSALTEAIDESCEQRSKFDELEKQHQKMTHAIMQKDAQLGLVRDQYDTARNALHETKSALDAAKLELLHNKKVFQKAKEQHGRVVAEDKDRIAALQLQLTQTNKYAEKNLSDQTVMYQDVQHRLQQERSRCTKLSDANSSLRERVTVINADLARFEQDFERAQSTTKHLEKDAELLRESLRKQKANEAATSRLASAEQVAAKQDADERLAESKASFELLERQHDAVVKRQQVVLEQQRTTISTLQSTIQNQKDTGGAVVMGDINDALVKASSVFQTLKVKSNNTIRKLTQVAEEQKATLDLRLTHAQSRAQSLSMQLEGTRADLKTSNILNGSLEMQNQSKVADLAATELSLDKCEKKLAASQNVERLLMEQCKEFEFANNRKARHILSYETIIAELRNELRKENGATAKLRDQIGTLLADVAEPPQVDVVSVTVENPAKVTSGASSAVPSAPTISSARGRAFGNIDTFSPISPRATTSRALGSVDLFSPQQLTPITPPAFEYNTQLRVLEQMGYGPRGRMIAALKRFNGNLRRVVIDLLP